MFNSFERIKKSVTAVRVTTENLREVAGWCGGDVIGTKLPVADQEVRFSDEAFRAPIGHWVVHDGLQYYSLSDEAFRQTFRREPLAASPPLGREVGEVEKAHRDRLLEGATGTLALLGSGTFLGCQAKAVVKAEEFLNYVVSASDYSRR